MVLTVQRRNAGHIGQRMELPGRRKRFMDAMNERGGVTEEDARNRVRCGQMIPCYIKLRSQKENKKTENRHFDYLSAWLQSI